VVVAGSLPDFLSSHTHALLPHETRNTRSATTTTSKWCRHRVSGHQRSWVEERQARSERVLVELFKGKEGDDRVRRETNGVRQEATIEGKRALSPKRL
jgi:hypothetical protein